MSNTYIVFGIIVAIASLAMAIFVDHTRFILFIIIGVIVTVYGFFTKRNSSAREKAMELQEQQASLTPEQRKARISSDVKNYLSGKYESNQPQADARNPGNAALLQQKQNINLQQNNQPVQNIPGQKPLQNNPPSQSPRPQVQGQNVPNRQQMQPQNTQQAPSQNSSPQPRIERTLKFCFNCGSHVVPYSNFCTNCGTKLN